MHEDSIFQFIDNQILELGPAIERNYDKWPILNEYVWPNAVITGSFEGEIEVMKNYISARLEWMDANMFGECRPSSTSDFEAEKLQVFPNPSNGIVNLINLKLERIEVFDVAGKLILQTNSDSNQIDLSNYHNGVYFLKIETHSGNFITKRIIKN